MYLLKYIIFIITITNIYSTICKFGKIEKQYVFFFSFTNNYIFFSSCLELCCPTNCCTGYLKKYYNSNQFISDHSQTEIIKTSTKTNNSNHLYRCSFVLIIFAVVCITFS